MNIAVLGAGNVGEALGAGWARLGHKVTFGVRNPRDSKYNRLSKAGTITSTSEAAAGAEVVLLAVPWNATEGVIREAGGLAGKIVLDATNPLGPGLSLTVGHTSSGGEIVAGWAPQARVVKIFNTTGFGNMANPRYGELRATMFYAGDDSQAKDAAHLLAAGLGFDPIDAGPLRNARLLEPLACLWIDLAMMRGHGRDIAFILHRRSTPR
jgi:hypothetical protein